MKLVAITMLAIVLILMVWVLVTAWYLIWGLWLVPYRVLRRGARKRKAGALEASRVDGHDPRFGRCICSCHSSRDVGFDGGNVDAGRALT